KVGADLLSETLRSFGSIKPRIQDHSASTLAPIMKKEDGRFDWTFPADRITRMVRGFQPFPTTYTLYDGKKLTIWNADSRTDNSGRDSGEVVATGDELEIACGEGTSLTISELQLEGKKRMSARDFLNGVKLKLGDRLR
ncbi:MAG: methionyl-tRNA formyltransferase, partial [Pyrinomonadaceae bacterium]